MEEEEDFFLILFFCLEKKCEKFISGVFVWRKVAASFLGSSLSCPFKRSVCSKIH